MTVLVVFRNEELRRCFLGVYSTLEKAEDYVEKDIQELEGMYEKSDYEIIVATVE